MFFHLFCCFVENSNVVGEPYHLCIRQFNYFFLLCSSVCLFVLAVCFSACLFVTIGVVAPASLSLSLNPVVMSFYLLVCSFFLLTIVVVDDVDIVGWLVSLLVCL